MEKFGLFDVISKILPALSANNGDNLEQKPSTKPHVNNENQGGTKPHVNTENKNAYSRQALLNYYKRHEEISKRIDKTLKK